MEETDCNACTQYKHMYNIVVYKDMKSRVMRGSSTIIILSLSVLMKVNKLFGAGNPMLILAEHDSIYFIRTLCCYYASKNMQFCKKQYTNTVEFHF